MSHALLTVQGPNRAGIVAEISQLLHSLSINISDSSMTTLRSEFVMMLLLELPPGLNLQGLAATFPDLEAHQLRLHLQALNAAEASLPTHVSRASHAISVIGLDQTGIVYRVSSVLAKHQINILDVDTQLLDRRDKPLYAMILEIEAGQADLEALTEALNGVATELNVDLNLHALDYAEI